MQRIKEEFVDKLETVISLKGKKVLEIGCGDGTRSTYIAPRCASLTSIEPDKEMVVAARRAEIPNVEFLEGTAEKLDFSDESFDVVMFTLSLHHVPISKMPTAINEAVRVVKKSGIIVFLEPGVVGSLFDAEIQFETNEGDETAVKSAAYKAMMHHPKIKLFEEIHDETIIKYDSIDDFTASTQPKKNLEYLEEFLKKHRYTLNAERRINIFRTS